MINYQQIFQYSVMYQHTKAVKYQTGRENDYEIHIHYTKK